jgi:hypothetical protein
METNNDFLKGKIAGIVHTRGRGNIKKYVRNTTGISYELYVRWMAKPSEFRMGTLKKIFDEYGFTNDDILTVFGRK